MPTCLWQQLCPPRARRRTRGLASLCSNEVHLLCLPRPGPAPHRALSPPGRSGRAAPLSPLSSTPVSRVPLPEGPGWAGLGCGRSGWGLQAEAPAAPGSLPRPLRPSPYGAQLPCRCRVLSRLGLPGPPHRGAAAPSHRPRAPTGGLWRNVPSSASPSFPFGFVGEGICGLGATGSVG